MSDTKLREAERRWRETGAAEDEGAYLVERVRAGELKRQRLMLAAYCGYRGARLALGDASPNVPADVKAWTAGVDPEVQGVATLAVGRLAQLLAMKTGKASMGPRTSTLRQAVDWAESEGADFPGLLFAVSQVALYGTKALRLRDDP